MILAIDPHSGVPVYRQLVEQIRFQVASGVVQPGEEIPSTRSLSALLGVNPMTVSKVLGLLEEEGVLERRPGLPHVVRRQEREDVRRARAEQLEAALRPAAIKARQLDVAPAEALEVFRRLLDEEE